LSSRLPNPAHAAANAYDRYGKGWHAAALNLGDCFAYALAKESGLPLLCNGEDFARTDVVRSSNSRYGSRRRRTAMPHPFARTVPAALCLAAGMPAHAAPPVCAIDTHLHAYASDPRLTHAVPNPVTGTPPLARDGATHIAQTLAQMRAAHVVAGIVSATPLAAAEAMAKASGGRVRIGYQIDALPSAEDLAAIRRLHAAGTLAYIGEVGTPYAGIRYDDPGLDPLWALAEELGVPVALHTGSGPPEQAYHGNPKARVTSGDPLAVEEALVRHPKLKVILMHMGWPFADATVALMNGYPGVMVDTGAIGWLVARPEFHAYLRRLVDNGWAGRILFGSDQMTWPEGIALARAGIDSAAFLTPAQKRLILSDNARRLFGRSTLPDCT
jgi:predicted TIM-barrel fold metal-dependent hydrolase